MSEPLNWERMKATKRREHPDDCTCDFCDLVAEVERLRGQLEAAHDVREMCITEAASWSNSIAEYCKHWEGRAEKAERELAEAREERAILKIRENKLYETEAELLAIHRLHADAYGIIRAVANEPELYALPGQLQAAIRVWLVSALDEDKAALEENRER